MKLITVVGNRPQFIKAAPVSRAIDGHNQEHPDNPIHELLVHTGQHYDRELSGVFFEELELKDPDYYLGVGSGSQAYQVAEMLKRLEQILVEEIADIVLVYGDTNSTLAAALAAAKLHIPVAHVEAGLRSFNRRMPEEINRVLTDHVSDLLFCPTETAVRNLEKEGFTNIINDGHLISLTSLSDATNHPTVISDYKPQATLHKPVVINVGDVMYDSVLYNLKLAEEHSHILERLNLQRSKGNELHEPNKPKGYALATVHRAENTDDPERLQLVFQALDKIACDELPVIVPLHPRTRKALESLNLLPNKLEIIEPISYLDMLLLEKHAKLILTDSGGVQKEAFLLRTPCMTLRDETEWTETVDSGWNILAGTEPGQIREAFIEVTSCGFSQQTVGSSPFGTGHGAERIVEVIIRKSPK